MEKEITVSSLLSNLSDQSKRKVEYVPLITDPNQLIHKKPIPTGKHALITYQDHSDRYPCAQAMINYSMDAEQLIYLVFEMEILCFLGIASGGIYGLYRGLITAKTNSFKIQVNSVLNQMTRYGPLAANSVGIMSIIF